jgi:RNA polymerase subunit RPABC4/transcription elongation factor Spt4
MPLLARFRRGSMEKRHISGREVTQDINSGMDDRALMNKYKLSQRELDVLMKKLVASEHITEAELSELQLLWAQKKGAAWHCPACHMPQAHEFEECPQCGIIVAKFKGKFPQEPEPSGTKNKPEQEFIEVPPEEPEVKTSPPNIPPAPPEAPDPNPKCPACSFVLPPDAKFCPLCGTKASER